MRNSSCLGHPVHLGDLYIVAHHVLANKMLHQKLDMTYTNHVKHIFPRFRKEKRTYITEDFANKNVLYIYLFSPIAIHSFFS